MDEFHNCLVELKTNEELGRHLVAKENISSGNILLKEAPLVVGPKLYTVPVCLGCHQEVKGEFFCSKCGYPMCSLECDMKLLHEENECKIFRRKGSAPKRISDYSKFQALYQSILPLRCLLLKFKSPLKWQALNKLEDHTHLRKTCSSIWDEQQVNIVQYLLQWNGLEDEFSEDIVNRVIGIIEVNSFQIKRANDSELCGVFPSASMVSHDCVPNLHNAFTEDGFIILRSSILIPKGEVLKICYVDPMLGTNERRKNLKLGKYFDCCCKRCQDPTEMGTFLSGIKCQQCESGYILPKYPLNPESIWICFGSSTVNVDNVCNFSTSTPSIQCKIKDISTNLDNVVTSDVKDPAFFKSFLNQYNDLLHHNHFLLLPIKRLIIDIESKSIHKIKNMKEINEKESSILELLNVLDKLEPGLTRARGILLHHLFKIGQLKLTFGNKEHLNQNYGNIYRDVSRLGNLLKELEQLFELDDVIAVKTI